MTLFCIFLKLIDKVYFSLYFFTVNSLLYCVCVLFALFAAVFRSFFGYAILKCSSKALAMYPSISVTLSIIGQIMQSLRTDAHIDTDTQKHTHTGTHADAQRDKHTHMHRETETHSLRCLLFCLLYSATKAMPLLKNAAILFRYI